MFHVAQFKGEHQKDLADYEGKGPAYTLFRDGEIVASAGFYVLWPGVAEAWMICTPLIFKYPLAFVRAVKEVFKNIDKLSIFTRIQATVRASDKRAVKFLEHLGFHKEGFMARYGPDGTDHFMMGRLS